MNNLDIFMTILTIGVIVVSSIVSICFLFKYRHKPCTVDNNLYIPRVQGNGGPNPCDQAVNEIEIVEIFGTSSTMYIHR